MNVQETTEILNGLRFHHIGVACRSIVFEQKIWQRLGYMQEGEKFSDPLQGVSGIFMTGSGPRIELLEPLNDSKTLKSFISSSIKMYHQAYETSDFQSTITLLKESRAKIVSDPKPAVAFGGRLVSFLMMPNSLIIELIELC